MINGEMTKNRLLGLVLLVLFAVMVFGFTISNELIILTTLALMMISVLTTVSIQRDIKV